MKGAVMPHYSYAEIAKWLVEHGWGSDQCEDEREIAKGLGREGIGDITGLGILKTLIDIQTMVREVQEAIAVPILKRYPQKLRKLAEETYADFMNWREDAHGVAPHSVVNYVWDLAVRRIGIQAITTPLNEIDFGRWYGQFPLPDKGTEVRKDYDRWMRRKPPKKEEKK
jgi:hypothetical protein